VGLFRDLEPRLHDHASEVRERLPARDRTASSSGAAPRSPVTPGSGLQRGGSGSGEPTSSARGRLLAGSAWNISLVVICGRNQRAYDGLKGLRNRDGRPVSVHGFVDQHGDWMTRPTSW